MIVWLASYPRSGNNWFRVVAQRLFGVASTSVYGDDRAPANPETLARMAAEPVSCLVKTHEPSRDDHPAICLVRDGRDALVSYAWFVHTLEKAGYIKREPRSFEDILRTFITTDADFGGWSANVLSWLQRPVSTVVVRFEDLISDPKKSVGSALQEAGFSAPPSDQSLPTFEELHQRSPVVFRKGEVGGWKTEMPEDLHEIFWQRHGATMRRLGYARESEAGRSKKPLPGSCASILAHAGLSLIQAAVAASPVV